MSCMSGSSNLNSFRDMGQVAVQLVSCGIYIYIYIYIYNLSPFNLCEHTSMFIHKFPVNIIIIIMSR